MMDKHIEDLSKPVAWTDAEELAELNGGTYANIFNGNHINTADGQWMPLYSQAYVESLLAKLEAAQFEIKELTRRLETPVPLPKSAYFKNSAENIPFFRAFAVIEAIHKAGFRTVTYED